MQRQHFFRLQIVWTSTIHNSFLKLLFYLLNYNWFLCCITISSHMFFEHKNNYTSFKLHPITQLTLTKISVSAQATKQQQSSRVLKKFLWLTMISWKNIINIEFRVYRSFIALWSDQWRHKNAQLELLNEYLRFFWTWSLEIPIKASKTARSSTRYKLWLAVRATHLWSDGRTFYIKL